MGLFLLKLAFLDYKGIENSLIESGYKIYECGYTEINTVSNFYTLQFFAVALSFMLFDLEIILVIPLVYVLSISYIVVVVGSVFLGVLMLGLSFEVYIKVF